MADFTGKHRTQLPCHRSLDIGHGRGGQRKVYVCDSIGLVDEAQSWAKLRSLVMVERTRHTDKGTSRHVRYYISSLVTTAERMALCVRGHWAIENRLHWQLDFTFGQDDSRLRKGNGPANLHLIRKWALYLLKKDPEKTSLKRKRKKAARNGQHLKRILIA